MKADSILAWTLTEQFSDKDAGEIGALRGRLRPTLRPDQLKEAQILGASFERAGQAGKPLGIMAYVKRSQPGLLEP